MAMATVDERRRRFLNYVWAALTFLLVLWIWKLSHPQSSLIHAYSKHNSSSKAVPSAVVQAEGAKGAKRPGAARPAPPKSLSNDVFNGTLSDKAAVIIETRFRNNLIPLILHFGSVLGSDWPIVVYTSAEGVGQFSASAALGRYIKSGSVQVRILPQEILFTNSDSVNKFMTMPWLWEDLAPAEHILLFQSDSMLCANAARSVDDFFAYDFVGAPIAPGKGEGYNGGLSLRKRSSILRVLDEWDWIQTQTHDDRFEDQWFYKRLKILQEREEESGIEPKAVGAINLPSMEVARTFSVETIDYPHPLGVHQVHRWLDTQMLSLDEWCPEYKLCSEDHVVDTPKPAAV